jgi:hypothetical protein
MRPRGDQVPLTWGGRCRAGQRFIGPVPALPDLDLPQPSCPLGAGRAFGFEGGAAGQVDEFGLSGRQVGPPQGYGVDADAVVDGEVFERVDGPRVGESSGAGARSRRLWFG